MKPPRHSRYARHRFPAEVISHVVWLYFLFLLSLRILAARGFGVSHETVRQWALKFGQDYANRIRRRHPDMTRPLSPDYDPARLTQFEPPTEGASFGNADVRTGCRALARPTRARRPVPQVCWTMSIAASSTDLTAKDHAPAQDACPVT
jgi:hypothetical protein